mmetsp:Transcript_4576/g.28998  ORF Transcript_4576/g.28998 Transcript_4576/m.28998 type:complete len:154 (+) Transcript_4576:81-542(+)
MPRFYCYYCDAHLTHDSPAVRKQHNTGFRHKANYRAYFFQFENALRDLNEESLPELNVTPEAAELQGQVAAAFQEEVNAIQGTNYSFPPPRMPGQFGPLHHGPPPGWNGPPPQHPGYGQPRYPPHGGPPHGAPPPGYGGPPSYGNGPPPRDWY